MKAVMYNYHKWIKFEDEKILINRYEKLLKKCGFQILKKVEHYFDIQGYTGLWLLAESHFAIHTFPEENKAYIEISSCVKEYFDNFLKEIKGN